MTTSRSKNEYMLATIIYGILFAVFLYVILNQDIPVRVAGYITLDWASHICLSGFLLLAVIMTLTGWLAKR